MKRCGSFSITRRSIKESIDSLPMGVVFYDADGLVWLSNHRMESICQMLTQNALFDGAAFYQMVSGYDGMCRLPDDTVVTFERHSIDLRGETLYELMAYDITEEYRLYELLQQKRNQLSFQNARLKALSATIGYVNMEREALATKVQVHDTLGQMLLFAKRSLFDDKGTDLSAIKEKWRLNVKMLRRGHQEIWQRPYFSAEQYARAMGVELLFSGEPLPMEEHLKSTVEKALMAHILNVVRHAKGTHAYVTVTKQDIEAASPTSHKTDEKIAAEEGAARGRCYQIRLTNDGGLPAGEIQETGGLKNLRQEVSRVGGEMRVESSPEFALILWLPVLPSNLSLEEAGILSQEAKDAHQSTGE